MRMLLPLGAFWPFRLPEIQTKFYSGAEVCLLDHCIIGALERRTFQRGTEQRLAGLIRNIRHLRLANMVNALIEHRVWLPTPTVLPIAPITLAMTHDTIMPFSFPAVSREQVTAAFDGGRLTMAARRCRRYDDGAVQIFHEEGVGDE